MRTTMLLAFALCLAACGGADDVTFADQPVSEKAPKATEDPCNARESGFTFYGCACALDCPDPGESWTRVCELRALDRTTFYGSCSVRAR